MELKRREQNLSERTELGAEEQQEVQQVVEGAERQWTLLLQAAEGTQR